MKYIDIILSSDNNYSQHLGVTICSIFENKKNDYLINIHVIDGGISIKNKNKLEILANKYSFNINYIEIETKNYSDLFLSSHITQAAYYRISIPNLVDKNIRKILYLDCDLIVLGDLLNLFNKNIENFFIGAVEEHLITTKRNLGMEESTPYFNSGVMLINLDKWRESNISEKTLVFLRENPEKINFWDQDALNAILVNKWLILENRYNLLTSEVERLSFEKEKNNINPIIVHYSSSIKPWKFNGENPFNNEYFYYLKKTPWNKTLYYFKPVRNMMMLINKIKINLIRSVKKIIKYRN